jgi:hypothetical protein
MVLSVILRFTASDYLFGIEKETTEKDKETTGKDKETTE